MAVKIDRHIKIDEIIARIYLDTKVKLSKKDLLEMIFDISTEDYNLLLRRITSRLHKDSLELRQSFINTFSGKLSAEEGVEPSIWVEKVEE